jgi:hypothetical protein
MTFSTHKEKIILKFIENHKSSQIGNAILKGEKKAISIPGFKIHYKFLLTKTS